MGQLREHGIANGQHRHTWQNSSNTWLYLYHIQDNLHFFLFFLQLTKESAEELQSFGINCDYRGETFCKGRGHIPTYFVRINDKLEFVKDIKPFTNHTKL